jgi:hypothetical protein
VGHSCLPFLRRPEHGSPPTLSRLEILSVLLASRLHVWIKEVRGVTVAVAVAVAVLGIQPVGWRCTPPSY